MSDPGQDYNALIETIEGYKTRAKIQKSVWLIVTSDSATEIGDRLKQYLDENDKLFVAKVSAPAAWLGCKQSITDWLMKHL